MNKKIFIPTYKRSHVQPTVSMLPSEWKNNIHLVIHPSEHGLYDKWGVNVLESPESCVGIGPTRQFIFDNYREEKFFMMDDDVKSMWALALNPELKPKWTGSTLDSKTFSIVDEVVDYAFARDAGMVSFCTSASMPTEGKTDKELFALGGRAMVIVAVNGPRICRSIDRMEYDTYNACEDFHVQFQLLSAGIPVVHAQSLYYAASTTQAEGGCQASGRTAEKHSADQEALAARWPKYVKVVENIKGGERWAKLRLQTKKAATDGVAIFPPLDGEGQMLVEKIREIALSK